MRTKREARLRRKLRIRRRVRGTTLRPRLAVFRSLRHIYAQVIDDDRNVTLTSAGSCGKEFLKKRGKMDKKGIAREVGRMLAERCKGVGISKVVFDRGGVKYHGRVAALAEGAREGGLIF